MTMSKTDFIIDAWAQPASPKAFERMPEIARLFKQSGSAHLLETRLTTDQIIEEMDRAGIARLMLSAWHRPDGWITHNDEIADARIIAAHLYGDLVVAAQGHQTVGLPPYAGFEIAHRLVQSYLQRTGASLAEAVSKTTEEILSGSEFFD